MAKNYKRKTYRSKRKNGKKQKRNQRTHKYRYKGGDDYDYDKNVEGYDKNTLDDMKKTLDYAKKECNETNDVAKKVMNAEIEKINNNTTLSFDEQENKIMDAINKYKTEFNPKC
jgi:hypothetical protein